MNTYTIKGELTCNEADTEEGFKTIEINETIETDDETARKAFEKFMVENTQYDFFGSLKTCDAETGGKKGATYIDQNEDQTIVIEWIP